ncbi:hypothetical protein ACFY2M_18970 [Streptomyces sp. NPDC001276]|uniref:hypothetical protein n=1 Tax=Streptomyces sp. NPDC001276 TaxID=3364555 RepID=UPI0036BF2493
MERHRILELYDWTPGVCFRHPRHGEVPTTVVRVLRPRAGGQEEVRACEDCVIKLEQERQAAASDVGAPYRPGHAGEALHQGVG